MDNKKSFASKLGQFVANVMWLCMSACFVAIMVALTIKLILWIL